MRKKKKVAILGGGITGLVAAFNLVQSGFEVVVFEKENRCGGFASGFTEEGWRWHLDRAYHHVFANDSDILNFSRKTGFSGFSFHLPTTSSLINSRIFPVDTPQDILKFTPLTFLDRLRVGASAAFFKVSPFLTLFETQTSQELLTLFIGKRAWKVFWEQMFRKKFGKYAEKICASFIWARIKKRTKKLGYPEGGFQSFVEHLVRINTTRGVKIVVNCTIAHISKNHDGFSVDFIQDKGDGLKKDAERFDRIISTLPTPVFTRVAQGLLSEAEREKLKKIKYLHAVNLILETDIPILEKTYWLSVCDERVPFMCVVQHTNLINKKHYGNNHISYISIYVDGSDWRLTASKEETTQVYEPFLRELNPRFRIVRSHLFKAPYAQPVYDSVFVNNRPQMQTSVNGLFVANIDLTYPYDRGTNYAVQVGERVSTMV